MTDAFGEVNLADPQTFHRQDLTDFWKRLRADSPVHWHPPMEEQPGFWVVSRYADIMSVYRDNTNFTSEHGNLLVTLLAGGDSAAGQMLAVTDGHRHRELRKIMLTAFSPRSLDRISERVRDNTRKLVVEAVERGECDFAEEIASRIPMGTIADLLGVPAEDRDFLLTLTKAALSSDAEGVDELDALMARNEILLYFGELVEQRRKSPADDVISVLACGEIDGRQLTEDEMVLNCYSLIIGGDETSRLSMIDSVFTLARHPEQWCMLRDGDTALGTATEEVLRWATPAMHFGRTCLADTEVGGVRIAAGDIVTLWHSSGNRDEAVLEDPYTFTLSRSPNKHMTFGYGPHFCLGAHLARVEVSELLDALRTFTRGFEITGPPQRIHSNFLTGFSSLPVRFDADPAGLESYADKRREVV
ncbi:Cytochrome P450 [Streptomyces sp. SceaMP-e96]|nr:MULTISPECIES: cytochrome P450 [unclassified Streptomyces]SCK30695.1 Cytochrome P450 [Streptomyces sp. SceaMP-e96]